MMNNRRYSDETYRVLVELTDTILGNRSEHLARMSNPKSKAEKAYTQGWDDSINAVVRWISGAYGIGTDCGKAYTKNELREAIIADEERTY